MYFIFETFTLISHWHVYIDKFNSPRIRLHRYLKRIKPIEEYRDHNKRKPALSIRVQNAHISL